MSWMFAVLATGAAAQLAIPAQAANTFMGAPIMVALCGGGAPIPLPTQNHDSEKPCCKICHSAMRKRGGADTCCSEEGGEEED